MRYLRVAVVGALLVAGIVSVARVGVTAADTDIQQVKDRAEMDALMWRYARALDTADPEAYASVYTDDGEFISSERTKGSAALKKMIADIKGRQVARREKGEAVAPMYHVITNNSVEFLGKDQAKYHAYWMTVFGPEKEGATPRVASVGVSEDLLVRVNGKWRIKSRNVRATGS